MDRLTLLNIDEELDSTEVDALRFLCRDVLQKKRMEKVKDAKELFERLDEKDLQNRHFLHQLLKTIGRVDLMNRLEADSSQTDASSDPETDASPILSHYRVMLYRIHEDMTQENVDRMKYLLRDDLGRRQLESCTTALDVMAEMEEKGLLSKDNTGQLKIILEQCDSQLAKLIHREGTTASQQRSPVQPISIPHYSMDNQRPGNFSVQSSLHSLSISESQPRSQSAVSPQGGQSVYPDSQPNTEPSSLRAPSDYYTMTRNPRGSCVIINNEEFYGCELKNRPGTMEDEIALRRVFTRLGFEVKVHSNMSKMGIHNVLEELGRQNFMMDDALVVCVLSHGEMGCVFGSNGEKVLLRDLTRPFISGRSPSLAGKPKLFFIQACQGSEYQKGAVLPLPTQRQSEGDRRGSFEEDAGPVMAESVPWDADFLMGMATVELCKSFRNTKKGSIYIQELCKQLERAAISGDDILSVLTHVNREVSKGTFLNFKQMPEPKYTLTKKLVLNFI